MLKSLSCSGKAIMFLYYTIFVLVTDYGASNLCRDSEQLKLKEKTGKKRQFKMINCFGLEKQPVEVC